MEDGFNVIHNTFDKALLILIGWFFSVSFLVWFLVNIIKTNNYFVWILAIPLGLIISVILVNQYKFNFKLVEKKNIFAQILFVFLLVLVIFYYLEPIIRYPMSTIGIPNKDLHDGISIYISDHGYAPNDTVKFAKDFYILSSQKGLYLGYPNLLHSFSALLIKLGVGIFHATWLTVIIGLVINSMALFILLRLIYKDLFFIAILSALFAISSFRIPIAAVASIPMMFSLILILPSLLIFILSINQRNELIIKIMPILTLSLLVISYGGTIVLFFGILLLLSTILIFSGKTDSARSLLKTIIFSVPLLAFCLFFQKNIYWENTFPTIKDYDPYELSQRLLPIDMPIYMFSLVSSLIFFIYGFKEKISNNKSVYKIFFFLLTMVFFTPIFYYFIFHILNNVPNTESLAKISPSGIFGGLSFQKISRLALFEPYIFIFFLGYVVYLIKKPWRYILLTIILLMNLLIRQNFSIYQIISPEVRESFYNQNRKSENYTLLSDLRLIINPQIWSKDIFGALDWLKTHDEKNIKILLWDERQWTEETIAGWGSIYIRNKIFRPDEYGIKELILNYGNLSSITNKKLFLLMINPSLDNLFKIKTITGSSKLYSQGQVFLFQLP